MPLSSSATTMQAPFAGFSLGAGPRGSGSCPPCRPRLPQRPVHLQVQAIAGGFWPFFQLWLLLAVPALDSTNTRTKRKYNWGRCVWVCRGRNREASGLTWRFGLWLVTCGLLLGFCLSVPVSRACTGRFISGLVYVRVERVVPYFSSAVSLFFYRLVPPRLYVLNSN
jgi:hypothetical protein